MRNGRNGILIPPCEVEALAGAMILRAPGRMDWGGFAGSFRDPDGHVWEIAMNPSWPLDPDGSLTLPDEE